MLSSCLCWHSEALLISLQAHLADHQSAINTRTARKSNHTTFTAMKTFSRNLSVCVLSIV